MSNFSPEVKTHVVRMALADSIRIVDASGGEDPTAAVSLINEERWSGDRIVMTLITLAKLVRSGASQSILDAIKKAHEEDG